MKKYMISGSDGTGKSTITDNLKIQLENENKKVETIWLRFNHKLAKVVNILGRIAGKSYYETYSWGKVGYHDYNGLIGSLYIYAVLFDHLLFRILNRKKIFEKRNCDALIIDRYIIDIMADLIVDTNKNELVYRLFFKYVKSEVLGSKVFILDCDYNIVISRREDIKDDKNWLKKQAAYRYLSKKLDIAILNTGENSIENIIKIIKGK